MTTFTSADAPVDQLGVPGPLVFNHTQFNLAWAAQPTAGYYVQEYVPAGEQVAHFHQMLTIYLLHQEASPRSAVQQKIQELEQRKHQDPTCNYAVNISPDGAVYLLDFILSDSQQAPLDVTEFNAYRYQQVAVAPGQTALLVYAYSRRSYGEAIPGFLTGLKDERLRLLNAMIAATVPALTLPPR